MLHAPLIRDHAAVPRPADHVTIVEVSPRDGLQNEQRLLPAAVKVELVDRLSAAGFPVIEVTSFVSPKAVPQLADAAEVMAGIRRVRGVRYTVLVPNRTGYERAVQAKPDGVVVFGAASETFSQRNINCSIAESMERFRPVVAAAKEAGLHVRGTISCALGCPYEGEIAPEAVAQVAARMASMGIDELSVADTIGVGTPEGTRRVMEAVFAHVSPERVNGHFHDTYQRALANIGACLDLGVRSFDASAAGLGGCPFAPGATGNVATELVLALMEERGFSTGVDAGSVRETGTWIRAQLAA
jgi:hydroxymethylglutaryl-CoA lyase